MAEAILRKYAGEIFEVYSAGLKVKEISPYTIMVMEEAGYDMSKHSSKTLDKYLRDSTYFGIVVTVCQDAED